MLDKSETQAACVLVVDDNEANRSLARNALEDEGYRVILASSGAEALVAVQQAEPDCVLLDVRMPGMDGFAVCEQIRGRGLDTPVIFLTALRDVDTFDRAQRVGGNDFLTKPVHPAELVIRVQAGLKLRRLRSELREHYEVLKQQRDAMLRLHLQKERLMSFLVHDLKNPVNSMDLQAQLLIRSKDSTPAVRDRARKIRAEARYLTRMLLNLLDLSKGDEGCLSPKRSLVPLQDLIMEVTAELEPSAQERDAILETLVPAISIEADADLLRRALTNLTENAIRHAPAGSAVRIHGWSGTGGIELRVADVGPGVPIEMRAKIFDPFVQIETGEQLVFSRNGRGLGLAFCKLAVEAHQGAIWVEGGNPGASFCLRLPFAPPPASEEQP